MNSYSVYEIETGKLTGQRISTSGDVAEEWIPEGCGVVLGEWHHDSWKVIHETGEVIPVTPPEPDWRLRKWRAMADKLAEIHQAEAEQARPIREIVEAMMGGNQPPQEAVEKMAGIKDRIEAARAMYVALQAVSSEEEMNEAEIITT